jgi:protein MpaA
LKKLLKHTYSKNNNEIQLFEVGNFDATQSVLIIGVFHGDEPEGEFLVNKLMQKISENPDLAGKNKILFIPCLNPDGKNANTRTNSNGVDLNRNFPTKNWELSAEKDNYYSGISPASEIETRFLIKIIEEYKPDKILTLHTPYRVVNYDGPAKDIAEEISKLNGYPVEESIGYPTPGSFGTYAGIERNIATITLELPENESLEKLWEENKEVFYYFIK